MASRDPMHETGAGRLPCQLPHVPAARARKGAFAVREGRGREGMGGDGTRERGSHMLATPRTLRSSNSQFPQPISLPVFA